MCTFFKLFFLVMLNSPRKVALSQTITGFTPPAKKAMRSLKSSHAEDV